MSRAPRAFVRVVLCAVLVSLAAVAGPSPGASGSALDALASTLAARVRQERAPAPVLVAVEGPAPALADALATLVAARLSDGGTPARRVSAEAPTLARAREERTGALLVLHVELDGALRAAGTLESLWVNVWAGREQRAPGGAVTLAAEVAPDAAVRLLARAAPGSGTDALRISVDAAPFLRLPVRTAALAAGDLDGDGRPELVVLTADEVKVLSSDGAPRATFALAPLARPPRPVREPFGTVCVRSGLVAVASAQAGAGVELRLDGERLVPTGRAPAPAPTCEADGVPATFVPGVARLRVLPAPGHAEVLAWGGDATAGARLLLLPDGTARWWSPGAAAPRTVADVGAGAALVPLDGTVHLVATSARAGAASDTLRLLAPDGRSGPAVEVPGRVLQVAALRAPAGEAGLVLGVWTADGGAELRRARVGP